jgi:hypothetical protein
MNNKGKFEFYWQNMKQSSDDTIDGEASKFLNFLCELLGIEKVHGEEKDGVLVYYLDMSSIKLKVTERTPFFIVTIRTSEEREINNLFLKIKAKIYENSLQDQVSFIIAIGKSDFFKTLCKDSLLDMVILDKSSLAQVAASEKYRSTFIKICKEQINVQRLSPYEIVDPVVGRMFYGRKLEMQQIINKIDTNFVIIGCRKIGKTSLILNAFRRMQKETTTFPIFLDCYPYKTADDFVKEVVTRLEIRDLRRMTIDKFHDFLRRMKNKYKKRITFILDEVDELLATDKQYGWKLFHILSAARNEGYCRFIISGYRTVFEESLSLSSPIFKFMEPVRINDIDQENASALITQPIRDMGIHIEDPGKIIEEILKQTARQPNLIQYTCKKLVEIESKRNTNIITFNDLLEVEKSSEYKHYITDAFILNSLTKEKLIVFCMLNYQEFSLKDINDVTEKKGLSLLSTELERICIILEMANVFHKSDGKYRFSNSALPKILKENYDMSYMINKLLMEVKQK